MTIHDLQQLKQHLLLTLPSRLVPFEGLLRKCDGRLWDYCTDVLRTDRDWHCVWEICALRDFIAKLEDDNITFHPDRAAKKVKAFEGFKSDTMRGNTTITATPQQVYILATVYGFYSWKDAHQEFVGQHLLPTEENRDGRIWDYRRLHTDVDLFVSRKFAKTHIGAFMCAVEFVTGPEDAEIYCTANALAQSKRLYNQTKDFIQQIVGMNSDLVRFTATETNWIAGNKYGRKGTVVSLSAGGKAKDGLKASMRAADEFGSAAFVKDHSDMSNLVAVVDSSMGPRREPLRLTTTTAGRVASGPYMLRLEALKDALANDNAPRELFAYLLQPDPWEITDEEKILTSPNIWKKVNPHLGITVQGDFYEKEIAKGRIDPDYMKEVLTKLFNIFQTDKTVDWIKPDKIRSLQIPMRVDQCRGEDGWICFAAGDFSQGDDLCGQSYLCKNTRTGEFFADCDAWISEETLNSHTNSMLYQQWVRDGWVRVSPGATINEHLVTNRLMELVDEKGVMVVRYGYDPYDAQRFVNDIKAWIFTKGQDPSAYVRPVKQTNGNYNSSVQEMEYMVKNDPPLIFFSPSPLWPWEFGNAVIDIDKMDNRRVVKRSQNMKVDNVQSLLSGVILYDEVDGKETK